MALEDTFNVDKIITPTLVSEDDDMEEVSIRPVSESSDINHQVDDNKVLKKNLKKTIKKASDALDVALEEQRMSPQNSKTTEAIAKLIDSLAKLNQVSLELNVREKEFEIKLNEKSPRKVVNNNTLNILGTSELIDKIIAKKKEK